MRLWLKMIRWTTVLSVIGLGSGCATPGNYCEIAQRPFQWQSDEEIDSTPIRVLRHVEDGADIWFSQGC